MLPILLYDEGAATVLRGVTTAAMKGLIVAIEEIAGPRIPANALRDFVVRLLRAAGADEESAAGTARAVIDASAHAFDTHGIRLVPSYLATLEGGRINPRPTVTVTSKAPAIVHVDADNGFGHRASYEAVIRACEVAGETGVAVATVGRSSHHGATGCYTRAAARAGFAAIGMTHADPVVVPFGGVKGFFGTNPLSFALPVAGEDPMVLDMATSAVPFNRVMLRRATGTPLPPEVAFDGEGSFTTDPNKAVALAPLGGAQFGHKGSGLAGMVDLLCSAFTGMEHGNTFQPLFGGDVTQAIPLGHFFIVLAPALFQSLAVFDSRVADFLADLRGQPGKLGTAVHAPSDLEKAEAVRRAASGIPVDVVTWAHFGDAAARLGVSMPHAIEL